MKKIKSAARLEKEIRSRLGGATSRAASAARYVGAIMPGQRKLDEQSQSEFWGHSIPRLRKLARDLEELVQPHSDWKMWAAVFEKSKIYDVKTVALIVLSDRRHRELVLKNWRQILQWADVVDNWALSDTLSEMIAFALEHEKRIWPVLVKWNRDKRPWRRRQSLVGIYCYARLRKVKVPAAKSLPLVKSLLRDPHFYVQRAVGWTLREIDRVDPKRQRKFVKKHLHDIGSVAWFATSELYPLALRKELVRERAARR